MKVGTRLAIMKKEQPLVLGDTCGNVDCNKGLLWSQLQLMKIGLGIWGQCCCCYFYYEDHTEQSSPTTRMCPTSASSEDIKKVK